MKSFVRISTSFFIGNKFVDFDISISVKNLSLFLQSFSEFYTRVGWSHYNEELPLLFNFTFTDTPSVYVNKLIYSGIKPDIHLITYSKYINNVLSKSK